MSYLLIRSIPMSSSTLRAWRSQDVHTLPGHVDLSGLESRILYEEANEICHYTGVINLGVSSFDPQEPDTARNYPFWWNRGAAIRMTRRPGDIRKSMGDLLAPQPRVYPADVWIKAPGHKGDGKARQTLEFPIGFMRDGVDIQLHVTGREFRVITVNHKVVQAFERFGENGDRSYEWRGLTNTPRAVKTIARDASRRIPGYNMYGWDIALGSTAEDKEDKPYILEANSAPGVNANTARRILHVMYQEYQTAHGWEGEDLELPDEEATTTRAEVNTWE